MKTPNTKQTPITVNEVTIIVKFTTGTSVEDRAAAEEWAKRVLLEKLGAAASLFRVEIQSASVKGE